MGNSIKPRIYTVATSHLDTSWNWDLETTIREYLPRTFKENFSLFEKYPEYQYSFEGSYRYELIEEYYPEAFEKIKEYIAAGRWYVTGSAYENGDVNMPSPEALFRNILFGNDYFNKKFGKRSVDIFLPDCFGFGYALPSVMNHANLIGFTTQKLTWSSAYNIPFDLGVWKGVDGKAIYASLDAQNYTNVLKTVRGHRNTKAALKENIKKYDLPFTYLFHGVGDRGGAPKESSVKVVCDEIKKNDKMDWDVLSAPADKVFRDMKNELSNEQKARLPIWDNELVSTDHGVGSYTSRAIGSRWNRWGEQLASAAERACVDALINSGAYYPQDMLNVAWKRIVAHQFHDDLTGTSLVACYLRNWNDYILSLNQLSEEYRAASSALAGKLNTEKAKGIPVVVSNPVQSSKKRTETVTAEIDLDEKHKSVSVFDQEGKEVPSGIISRDGKKAEVVFSASVPSVGYAVYDVQASEKAEDKKSNLSVSKNSLENEKYLVNIDGNGDISSVYDKEISRELLRDPIRFAVFSYKGSASWPAWELDYKDISAPPRTYAQNPTIEIVENNPARVMLKISQKAGKSKFVKYVSLDAQGKFVRVQNEVDWRSLKSLLKVEFPLVPESPKARYDLGLGSIERGNNTKNLYEVPAQMWADISDDNENFGVSIFSDSKTGWDKPNNHTLRMTVVHTPQFHYREESAQHLMDLGINRFGYGIFSHSDEVKSPTVIEAENFNQTMNTFVTEKHSGSLGTEHSLCTVSHEGVVLRAIKKAENSDEIIVRFNETENKNVKDICFTLSGGIVSAREIYASEEGIGPAKIVDGKLYFDLDAFNVKSFALNVKTTDTQGIAGNSKAIELPFNVKINTSNSKYEEGVLPAGLSIPTELFPKKIVSGQQEFQLSSTSLNALQCKGQKLALSGNAEKIYILASAVNGDKEVEFKAGKKTIKLKISDMFERVGKWDMIAINEAAHIKRDVLAWNATHVHDKQGDVYAKHAYIFKYELEIPAKTKELLLPNDDNIFIFAAIEETSVPEFKTACLLYDAIEEREMDYWITDYDVRDSVPNFKEGKKSWFKFAKNFAVKRTLRKLSPFLK